MATIDFFLVLFGGLLPLLWLLLGLAADGLRALLRRLVVWLRPLSRIVVVVCSVGALMFEFGVAILGGVEKVELF